MGVKVPGFYSEVITYIIMEVQYLYLDRRHMIISSSPNYHLPGKNGHKLSDLEATVGKTKEIM